MFRTSKSDVPSSLGVAAWVVVGLLSGAGAISLVVVACALRGAPTPVALAAPLAGAVVLAAGTFVWFWRRMTASHRALRRVKLLAHDILAGMEQGVITADDRGAVTSINSGAMGLLGVDDSCVGAPLAGLASDDLPLVGLWRRVTERHEHVRDQEYAVVRGGRPRRLLVSAHVLKDAAGHTLGCVLHVRDVTERMRMKEQVWRLERLAGLSNLAAGLHHEIKNPLTALSIHVQLIEERLRAGGAPGPLGELVGVLKAEVRRLNGVLERFRDYASLQRITLRPTDPLGVLEGVARLIGPQAERQGVRLSLDQPGPAPPAVPLDEEKFREAVLNLVVNALDAMPDGGDLTLSARAAADALVVEVGDTGPGIPEEIRGDLFKPYVSTKRKGTGMGLALTEKLISQHGGQVSYQTGPGGTVFRLTLPLSERARPAVATPAGVGP
jgi:signal transduction histidine kinase